MNTELSNTDKLNLFYEELKRLKIDIRPPNINKSFAEFLPRDKVIYYALSAIKAVGSQAVSNIVKEREKEGSFKSISDLLSRVESANINKLQLEGLIKSGSFDEIDPNRKKLFDKVSDYIKQSKSSDKIIDDNQSSLFGENENVINFEQTNNDVDDWDQNEKIKKEFESIGFFVGEHPLKSNLKILDQYKVIPYLDLKNDNKIKDSMIAGTLISIQEKKTAKGNPYAIIKLVDLSTMYELFIFSEKLVDNRKKLIVGNSFLIKAKKETNKDGMTRVNMENIFLIDDLKIKKISKLILEVKNEDSLKILKNKLNKEGETIVEINYFDQGEKKYQFKLDQKKLVKLEDIDYLENNNISAISQ